MNQQASMYRDVLRSAVGGKVIDMLIEIDEHTGEQYLGLVLEAGRKHKTQWVIWVLRDEEGNGPGALQIQKRQNPPGVDIDEVEFQTPERDFWSADQREKSRIFRNAPIYRSLSEEEAAWRARLERMLDEESAEVHRELDALKESEAGR